MSLFAFVQDGGLWECPSFQLWSRNSNAEKLQKLKLQTPNIWLIYFLRCKTGVKLTELLWTDLHSPMCSSCITVNRYTSFRHNLDLILGAWMNISGNQTSYPATAPHVPEWTSKRGSFTANNPTGIHQMCLGECPFFRILSIWSSREQCRWGVTMNGSSVGCYEELAWKLACYPAFLLASQLQFSFKARSVGQRVNASYGLSYGIFCSPFGG